MMAYDIIDIPASAATYSAGRAGVDYIVVHYTGAPGSARDNGAYFSGGNRSASAHYFIDDDDIVASVPESDTAWHAGNFWFNRHSIGIEVCSDGGDFSAAEVDRLHWLVQDLMARYGVPAGRVCRHHDAHAIGTADGATGGWVDPGKDCPAPYVSGDPTGAKWRALWATVTAPYGAAAPDATADGATMGVPAETYRSWARDVQRVLSDKLGAFGAAGVAVDGVPGRETQRGLVRLLQLSDNADYGLSLAVDGIIGPATLAAIAAHPVGFGCETSGNDVWSVKAALVLNGWDVDIASGEWGQTCADALGGHQAAHGLDVDGVCGAATLPTLLPMACA